MTTTSSDEALLQLGYQPSLRRNLSFASICVYGLLFFVPLAPVAVFGPVVNLSGGVPVLVYLVAALVMGASALSYREMALRYPVAGSVYGYARLSVGPRFGFVAGWLILLDYLLMPALLVVLAAVALAHVVPVPVWVIVVAFAVLSMALNLAGLEITTRVGLALLAVQAVVLGAFVWFVGAAVASGTIELSLHALWRPGTSLAAVFGAASIAALSYLGFDAIATLNEEAKGGGRAVGWATMLLLGVVTGLFCLQVFAASLVSDATRFAAGAATDRAFYTAVDAVAPAWFTPVFTVVNAFVAIFACLVVAHAATARLLFAMARDRVLPAGLAVTSKGVPARAIVLTCGLAVALGLTFSSRLGLLTSLVTFGALSAYVLLHVSVVVRCMVVERTGRWFVHGVVPVFGAATLLAILANTQPLTRTIGLSWLAVGILAAVAGHRIRRR